LRDGFPSQAGTEAGGGGGGGAGFASVLVMTFPPQAVSSKRARMMGESLNMGKTLGQDLGDFQDLQEILLILKIL
jgi:hypothetical protein